MYLGVIPGTLRCAFGESEASAAWTERVAGDVAAVARAFPPQATEKLRACAAAASGRYP